MDERRADEEPIAGADGAGNRPIVAAMAMRAHLPPDGGHKIDLMDTTPSSAANAPNRSAIRAGLHRSVGRLSQLSHRPMFVVVSVSPAQPNALEQFR